MFPAELLTFGGTALLGGGMKMAGNVINLIATHQKNQLEMKKVEHDMDIEAGKLKGALMEAASLRGGPMTRRIITLVTLFTVFLSPVLFPVLFPEVPIHYLAEQVTPKRLWGIFGGGYEKLDSFSFTGVLILPIHTHMASAIAGFYFGIGACKK